MTEVYAELAGEVYTAPISSSLAPNGNGKPHTEKRRVETKNTCNDYDFLVLDTPEKWLDAKDFKGRYELDFGGRIINVPLMGISYIDWELQEEMYPFPDKPTDKDGEKPTKEDLEAHEVLVETIHQQRKVYMFQNVTGKAIPGQEMAEKVNWLNSRGYDAVESFQNYLELFMTGLADGEILAAYDNESAQAITKPQAVDFTSFEDWDTAADTHAMFRFCRKFDDFIVEIPLRRVPHELKEKIDRETQVPDPPQKPGRNPLTKKFDPAFFKPDTKDSRWLQTCASMRHKKIIMVLEATLPFQIPGSDIKEKYNWVNKKLMGDVYKIQQFVFNELLGYRRQLDFFTIPSAPKS